MTDLSINPSVAFGCRGCKHDAEHKSHKTRNFLAGTAAAVATAGAITAGVVYRKNIKSFAGAGLDFVKKLPEHIKNLPETMKKIPEKLKQVPEYLKKGYNAVKTTIGNAFRKTRSFFKKPSQPSIFDNTPGYSNETKGMIKKEILDMFSTDKIKAEKVARKAELRTMREDAIVAFSANE